MWNAGGEQETYVELASVDGSTFAYTQGGLAPYAGLPFKWKIKA
jgi:hypothetical protein